VREEQWSGEGTSSSRVWSAAAEAMAEEMDLFLAISLASSFSLDTDSLFA
jgi:hypothetical protein